MFKYFLPMTALMISTAGVGVSLAREEFRCYLGLSSSACDSSEVKSASPPEFQPIFNQEATKERIYPNTETQERFEQETPLNAKASDSLTPDYQGEQEENTSATERINSDSKFISVEELSRIPEKKPDANFNNSVPSGEEGYVGIPIEVEPFNEQNN
ncbi:MAG: hypothetical protein WBM32_22650 [Crocosphaera sp.]